MKTCMVWDRPTPLGELPYGAHIGTHSLHNIVGIGAIWWIGDKVASVVGSYDAYIVNVFADNQQVTQIRDKQPDALIVALPDVAFDEMFTSRNPAQEALYIAQLKAADVIGYVSESNRQFYSVFGKPMVQIPMPIGTPEFFADARLLPKDDFIITCDHSPLVVDYTIQNVAACALIQKETGLRVVYTNPGPQTPFYAEQLGLKAEFRPKMIYENYVRLAARARLGVDMYARHGFGRNELTLAYVGTPYVAGRYTDFAPGDHKTDPWFTFDAQSEAKDLLDDNYQTTVFRDGKWREETLYENNRLGMIDITENNHGFTAIKTRWPQVLQEIEQCRTSLPSN